MKKGYLLALGVLLFVLWGKGSSRPMMPPATTYYTITGGNLDAFIWSKTSHAGASCSCAPCLCSPCNIPSNTVVRIAHPVTVSCNIEIGSNTTLIIESGGSLNVTGNSSISGTGNLQIDAGGNMNVSGNMNLSGTGSVLVNGHLDVDGNLSMGGSSTLCGSGTMVVNGTVNGNPCFGLVLPVELVSFEAVLNGAQVNLNWITASEKDNAYFTVERSKDGETWTEITRVNAIGTTHQVTGYTGVDQQPLQGTAYYRLKQTDVNGKFTYSNIQVVKNDNLAAGIYPFPNPNGGQHFSLGVSGFGHEDVRVVVKDIQGREFYSHIHTITGQQQTIAIDLHNRLGAGIYLVVLTSGKTQVSSKMVVQQQ